MLMVTGKPIGGVVIEAPESASRGDSVSASITVAGADGEAIDAVVPLQVRISDPEGVESEFTG